MPQTWQKARDSYKYPVRLADFDFEGHRTDRHWFEYDTGNGDRSRTMEFEDRFRKLAPHYLEAWYEVVYWENVLSRATRSCYTKRYCQYQRFKTDRQAPI